MEKISVCSPMLCGNELKYVTDAVNTAWISGNGSYVERFEKAFAEYCGVKHGIAVCNGTAAIHLALVALGISEGDEVIIPSFTMIATAFAICYIGAVPIFVDVDSETWNIDVTKIEEKITEKTKAIIPVHIFGNPCKMDEIKKIADKYSLFVVEDAAEAHGMKYKKKEAGSFSDISAFSFFANKNITTGEGGMCVTNNDAYADLCRYYKNMCFPISGVRNYSHNNIGFNYRMSNIHAAIGLAQVENADFLVNQRIEHHLLYKKLLENCPGIIFQKDETDGINVGWMNAIIVDSKMYGHTRDELINYLRDNGVETRLLFKGMHRQKSLKDYGCDCLGNYWATDRLSENGLYLPSGSNLLTEQIEYIAELIKEFHKNIL